MRPNVDAQKIEQLMQALGREAQGSGCIYFTGGATALLIGWRSSTIDVDIRLDTEPLGIFQAIAYHPAIPKLPNICHHVAIAFSSKTYSSEFCDRYKC